MDPSHQTTEQLQQNRHRIQHAENYGRSIAGQRLLDAYDKELSRRAAPSLQAALPTEHCGGDCGDCNDNPAVNNTSICHSCSNDRCCIESRNATACVEYREATA